VHILNTKPSQNGFQKPINMKYIFALGLVLGHSLSGNTQQYFKNELSLGYFSAGEFFDETPFKISAFNKGRYISINYSRQLKNNLFVGLSHTRSGFQYISTEIPRYHLKNNTIEFRSQRVYTAYFGQRFSTWLLDIRGKAGIRYNRRSYKSKHLGGGWHSKGWYESFGVVDRYGWLGASLGVSIAHPIFWRVFGEFDSEYARMFNLTDRNQLLLSYRIGIRF